MRVVFGNRPTAENTLDKVEYIRVEVQRFEVTSGQEYRIVGYVKLKAAPKETRLFTNFGETLYLEDEDKFDVLYPDLGANVEGDCVLILEDKKHK